MKNDEIVLEINNLVKKYFENMSYDFKAGQSKIPLAVPSYNHEEVIESIDSLLNTCVTMGKKVKQFEEKFAAYVGRKHAIMVNSGSSANLLSLAILTNPKFSKKLNSGDEVITPALTWSTTVYPMVNNGLKPVFVDVDPETFCLDENKIEEAITEKTKAIMPVHLYGMPANCDKLKEISKKYKIKIIEDAAPAIGATYKKIACGNLGEFSAFSFQGAKLLVTGEGGMLTTNNYQLYKKALKISDFGRDPKKTFWISSPGVKFKMSNIQAALGLGQLSRLNEMIKMKRTIFKWYEKFLDENNCKLIKEPENSKSIYWMTSIILKKGYDRNKLIKLLSFKNVDSRPCFPSISSYPIWKHKISKKESKLLKNSKIISKQGLNLPSGVQLRENDIKKVCNIINSYSK